MSAKIEAIAHTFSLTDLELRDYQQYVLHNRALQKAMAYLYDFAWCNRILSARFGCGVGGVFAVFLIEIENSASPLDNFLWVFQGDMPPAYFVTQDIHTPREALEVYIEHLVAWTEASPGGLATGECIPIDKPVSENTLRALGIRLTMLRTFLQSMG